MDKNLKDTAEEYFRENANHTDIQDIFIEGVEYGYQLERKETYQMIQRARYALVDGNPEPVPVDTIRAWLDIIETSL